MSRYAGERHKPIPSCASYKSAATLTVRLSQQGADEPTITLHAFRRGETGGPDPLDFSVDDARDLIAALQYVVGLAEGTRTLTEGTEG